MQQLLQLTAIVEPDRQRLARFVLDAVAELGGNGFAAGSLAAAAIAQLRRDGLASSEPLTVILASHDQALWLCWGESRLKVAALPSAPDQAHLSVLAERLKRASDLADPELLRRRNERIEAELERSMQHAAEEMAVLEGMLERKKQELQASIKLAETDSLTGLFNRRAYDVRLAETVARCLRQNEPLSLILLDLDHFKKVNDTHGHQYGDDYLRRMGEVMRTAIRAHVDVPCRIGGDEFAILALSKVDIAQDVAERVLQAMDGRVSVGIAGLQPEDTVESLVERADMALYEAKDLGRGRVTVAEDLERPRLLQVT